MINLGRILLVEDDPKDVELTLTALDEFNLANEVHVARDGAEALDYLYCTGPYQERARGLPAVMLLDLKLPKVDGLEVLKRIKDDEAMRMIPIVVLTSSREERDMVASYKLGVNAYVVKPVDFREFVSAIKELGVFGIQTTHYPSLTALTAYRDQPPRPRTEGLALRHLLLPLASNYTERDVDLVATEVKRIMATSAAHAG